MNVKQLKEILQHFPDEYELILSKDSEGNMFSPLASLEECKYIPETGYMGEAIFDSEDEEESPNAICLWPTN